jgi:hypothetical protein
MQLASVIVAAVQTTKQWSREDFGPGLLCSGVVTFNEPNRKPLLNAML